MSEEKEVICPHCNTPEAVILKKIRVTKEKQNTEIIVRTVTKATVCNTKGCVMFVDIAKATSWERVK